MELGVWTGVLPTVLEGFRSGDLSVEMSSSSSSSLLSSEQAFLSEAVLLSEAVRLLPFEDLDGVRLA